MLECAKVSETIIGATQAILQTERRQLNRLVVVGGVAVLDS